MHSLLHVQGDKKGKVNNLGGDSVDHCAKISYDHLYNLNGYRDRAVTIFKYDSTDNINKGQINYCQFSF